MKSAYERWNASRKGAERCMTDEQSSDRGSIPLKARIAEKELFLKDRSVKRRGRETLKKPSRSKSN